MKGVQAISQSASSISPWWRFYCMRSMLFLSIALFKACHIEALVYIRTSLAKAGKLFGLFAA
jgi:hypothetical protein